MISSWAWTTHQWTGGLKKRMVAGFPRPCLLKDFTIIILGQHEGFSRILRWPSLVFATSMTPFFQALGSKNYYGANSFLLEFIVYVNFLMLLLRLPALTPALKLTSSLLCLNLTYPEEAKRLCLGVALFTVSWSKLLTPSECHGFLADSRSLPSLWNILEEILCLMSRFSLTFLFEWVSCYIKIS